MTKSTALISFVNALLRIVNEAVARFLETTEFKRQQKVQNFKNCSQICPKFVQNGQSKLLYSMFAAIGICHRK